MLACLVPSACTEDESRRVAFGFPEIAQARSGRLTIDSSPLDPDRNHKGERSEERRQEAEQGRPSGKGASAGRELVGTNGSAIVQKRHFLFIMYVAVGLLIYLGTLGILASIDTHHRGRKASAFPRYCGAGENVRSALRHRLE